MPVYVNFMISFYFWLTVILLVATSFTAFIVIKKNGIHLFSNTIRDAQTLMTRQSSKPRQSETNRNSLKEKLGEKVVQYMVDITHSNNRADLKKKVSAVTFECEKLQKQPLPEESRKIISTVLFWSKKFNIEKHIREMSIYGYSSQIEYDATKKDFKLKVTG